MGVLDEINLENVPRAQQSVVPSGDRRIYGPQGDAAHGTGGVLDEINFDNVPTKDGAPKIAKETTQGTSQRTNHPADQDVPDLSLGDVASGAAHNFGKDFVETAKGIGEGVMHPIRTVKAIGEAGKGALSKAAGAVGIEQDPVAKEENERVVNSLIEHYKDRYGSWKKIKNTAATHPVGTLMDVSTPFSLGASGAAKAVGEAGVLGKTLSTASKAAAAMDPINASIRVAGQVARIPNTVFKPVTSLSASVPKSALDLAEAAGRSSDPLTRDAFWRHFTGKGDAREILNTAQDAIERARDAASTEYGNSMAGQAATAAAPDYTNIKGIADYLPTHINGVGSVPRGQFANRNALAAEIKTLVDGYAASPGKQNYLELDRLKRAISDKAKEYGANSGPAAHDVGLVTSEIKEELERIAPGYYDQMEKWQKHLDDMRDLTQGLGVGQKADAARAIAKMLRQQKSHNGQHLIQSLAQYDSTLPYMLAGVVLNPLYHGGARGILDAAGPAAASYILSGAPIHPLGIAATTYTSPRVAGGTQFALGAAQRGAALPKTNAAAYSAYESNWRDPLEGDKSQTEDKNQPRGERNFNRGNLEDGPFAQAQPGYAGTDGRFAKFKDDAAGTAAADALIQAKFRTGKDTVRKLISSWTPPKRAGGDNDDAVVEQKIAYIARKLGVNPDQRLDGSSQDLRRLLFDALSDTENGATIVRAARASGGRIIDHGKEADRLIASAESGLNHQNKTTEPLLGMHDDAVATALKTADRYI